MTFMFPFPSHSHRIIHIPIPGSDYLKAEKYEYCVVNSKQNMKLQQSIVNQTHYSSIFIIITITAYHCSLFNVYQTVTACCCAGCSHRRWEFYCSPIKYAIPIPIPVPISISKLVPFPWELHGNLMGFPLQCTPLVLLGDCCMCLP